jgi:hypothetical protein
MNIYNKPQLLNRPSLSHLYQNTPLSLSFQTNFLHHHNIQSSSPPSPQVPPHAIQDFYSRSPSNPLSLALGFAMEQRFDNCSDGASLFIPAVSALLTTRMRTERRSRWEQRRWGSRRRNGAMSCHVCVCRKASMLRFASFTCYTKRYRSVGSSVKRMLAVVLISHQQRATR